jgi:hypothetical protein
VVEVGLAGRRVISIAANGLSSGARRYAFGRRSPSNSVRRHLSSAMPESIRINACLCDPSRIVARRPGRVSDAGLDFGLAASASWPAMGASGTRLGKASLRGVFASGVIA